MVSMEEIEQYDNVLEDDALAPLKRNHACLQCKKRKVKCDAVKPTCSPCLRSHAHAVRAATRNGTAPPTLVCTYTDGDQDEVSSNEGLEAPIRKDSSEKKKGVKRPATGVKAGVLGSGPGPKAKEKKLEEERDVLKIKIAELERRLAQQTPSTTASSISADPSGSNQHKNSMDDYRLPSFNETTTLPVQNVQNNSNQFGQGSNQYNGPQPQIEEVFDQAWPSGGTNTYAGATNNVVGNMDLDWDVGGLFMVPANWPMNLPSPFLLEHLIETFFNCVPQIPRMIHKGNLFYRVRLPPTHKDFPHASLLHAICAIAATHTAWVNSIPPEKVEETTTRAIACGQNLEEIEDFGLAQAFAARRAMDQSATCCAMGSGSLMFGLVQAAIILAEVFFQKGMPLQGWLMAGMAPRLIKSLELGNRNHGFKRYKEPMLPPPKTAIEREERIATVWMAHIQDSGFAINSYWSQSMEWRELKCGLPTSTAEFRKKDPEFMMENPQSAFSQDVLTEHPVADTFILVVKASLLMSRTAKWLQEWHQREICDNDEMIGLSWPSFIDLVRDIHAFQQSIPAATRNVFRILDQPSSGFDSNLLLVHILPNIALCLIHEPFVDWKSHTGAPLHNVQKSYEGIVGMLHLIPSNLDVSLVMTPLLAFSMYTTGRIVANFMQKALDTQSYSLAMRYRADLSTIQSILGRHGLKHTLGGAMSEYLSTHLRPGNSAPSYSSVKSIESSGARCLDPTQAESFPTFPPGSTTTNPVDIPSIGTMDPNNGFPTNTAQFQDRAHVDFGIPKFQPQGHGQVQGQGQGQGIDMSAYLTQMSMGVNTNNDANAHIDFNTNFDLNLFPNATTTSGSTHLNYFPQESAQNNGNMNGKREAHISPVPYSNSNSNTHTNSNSGQSSYASSRNMSGSSKTTPDSSGFVEPLPTCFEHNGNGNGNGNGVSPDMGYMIYGQEPQGQVQTRFAQMERYFDTIPNQDAKMY